MRANTFRMTVASGVSGCTESDLGSLAADNVTVNLHVSQNQSDGGEAGRAIGVRRVSEGFVSALGVIRRAGWPLKLGLGAAAGFSGALLRLVIGNFLPGQLVFVTFYPVVGLAALFGGFVSGTGAVVVSLVAVAIWCSPASVPDFVLRLTAFLFYSAAMCGLAEGKHRAMWRLGLAEGRRRDVTAEKAAAHALQRSQAQVRRFVENAPVSIAMFDGDMNYVAASRRWIENYGRGRSQLVGLSHYELHPAIPERWKAVHRRALKGEFSSENDDYWIDDEGQEHWVRWVTYPWTDDAGEIGGVVISAEEISAQKRAEMALRESEERFRNAFAEAAIGFVMAEVDGAIVEVNRAYCRLTGYAADELKSMRLIDLVHPDDRAENLVLAERLRSGEIPGYVIENRYVRKDGETIWVRKSLSLSSGAASKRRWVVNLVEDVTERKRAAETAARTVTQLTAVLDGAKDTIIAIDVKGTVQSINAAGEKMFGYERDEVVGRNIRMLMPDRSARQHDDYIANYLRTGVAKIIGVGLETEGRRKDGSVFPMDLAIVEAAIQNELLFVGFVRDLSERRRIEMRIDQLAAQRLTAIGGMAGALAHELNQPLAAIGVYLETARRMLGRLPGQRPATLSDALDRAGEQVARMGGIIRHLRQFAAHGEPDKTYESLHALIREVSSVEFPDGQNCGPIQTHDLGAADDGVLMDRIQVGQVLSNLLRNAREAMAEVPCPRILISTSQIGNMICCAVSDNGAGLAEAVRDRLFEPLTSAKATGMGIGLSISKSIIEAHYGEIWAEPNPGGGTIFSFTLPLTTAEGDR